MKRATTTQLADWLEAPLLTIGRACGWLALACVLLTFGIVVLRYGFGQPALAVQELVLHMNAAVFLLGGAYALVRNQHVRVDILQQGWSPRTQAIVEIVGIVVLLLPFCVFLVWISLDYVAASVRIREGSREVGGLPGLFLVKALIPLSALLLTVAGIARGLRMGSESFNPARTGVLKKDSDGLTDSDPGRGGRGDA